MNKGLAWLGERKGNQRGGGIYVEGEGEIEVRKAGIDGKEFSRKYGGRVPETVVSDDAINGEYVVCFES